MENSECDVQYAAVPKLTEGITSIYEPDLKVVKEHLIELNKKQELICRELHDENLKFSEMQFSTELQEMFTKVKVYKEKLANIRKKMSSLHERSVKVRKRALKLEQNKQNEAKQRAQQREKEEQLIGKMPQL